eukprot:CAMPEP_0179854266 /NCGR_PEP_ID=MMETSP0982-20121206/9834_1 /TAXON_ID=483367 /ORGANISM="non described non described, Strain CCMP 2436" /LENGTH=176 /DNA_ID=CAMNT_0021740125 /DNA_START=127 /DNA_END=657 /DNA_ORIENTATION=+
MRSPSPASRLDDTLKQRAVHRFSSDRALLALDPGSVDAGVDGFGGGEAARTLSFLPVPVVLGFILWPESTCGFFYCARVVLCVGRQRGLSKSELLCMAISSARRPSTRSVSEESIDGRSGRRPGLEVMPPSSSRCSVKMRLQLRTEDLQGRRSHWHHADADIKVQAGRARGVVEAF